MCSERIDPKKEKENEQAFINQSITNIHQLNMSQSPIPGRDYRIHEYSNIFLNPQRLLTLPPQ